MERSKLSNIFQAQIVPKEAERKGGRRLRSSQKDLTFPEKRCEERRVSERERRRRTLDMLGSVSEEK